MRVTHKSVLGKGIIDPSNIYFDKLTVADKAEIEKLIGSLSFPLPDPLGTYIGPSRSEKELKNSTIARTNQRMGAVGENLAKYILKYLGIFRGIRYLRWKIESPWEDDFISKLDIKEEELQEWINKLKLYYSRHLFGYDAEKRLPNYLLLWILEKDKPTRKVDYEIQYVEKPEKDIKYTNLENYCQHIFIENYRITLKKPFKEDVELINQIYKDKENIDRLRPIFIPGDEYYSLIEEKFNISFSHYLPLETKRKISSYYSALTTLDSYLKDRFTDRILSDKAFAEYYGTIERWKSQRRQQAFLDMIEDLELKQILRSQKQSFFIQDFDLCMEAKYTRKRKTSIIGIEVKSSNISCDKHKTKGPISLSRNQREKLHKLLDNELTKREVIISLSMKLNFCTCGKIFYFVTRPELL